MVSNKCCVPGCRQSSKTKFGVPRQYRDSWEKALNITLNRNSRVCAKHFKTHDVIDTWVSGEGLNKYSVSKLEEKKLFFTKLQMMF